MEDTSDSSHGMNKMERVEISLENCIIPEYILRESPSLKEGMCESFEKYLRYFGCELIQVAGTLLKLPQTAMATGQILYQRFFYCKSFLRHDFEIYAMASLYLASKIEEHFRRARDIVNVFRFLKQQRKHMEILPMEYYCDQYLNLKSEMIKAERRILKELGFCVHVQHPHKMIISILNILNHSDSQDLTQKAWNFMNDSLRGTAFLRYSPAHISCACIVLAARLLKIELPEDPPWWIIFDLSEDILLQICQNIMSLYIDEHPPLDVIEAFLNNRRKELHISTMTFSVENKVEIFSTNSQSDTEKLSAERKEGNNNENHKETDKGRKDRHSHSAHSENKHSKSEYDKKRKYNDSKDSIKRMDNAFNPHSNKR